MKKTKLTMLTIAAIAVSLPLASQAKGKSSPSPSPAASPAAAASPAKTERPIPYHGKVSSVNASAKTFSMTSKEGKETVFKIVSDSVITKAGKPATFADIVKDEEIRGSYWKKADGSREVKSAKLGPKTAEEIAADEARKAKKATKAAAKSTP